MVSNTARLKPRNSCLLGTLTDWFCLCTPDWAGNKLTTSAEGGVEGGFCVKRSSTNNMLSLILLRLLTKSITVQPLVSYVHFFCLIWLKGLLLLNLKNSLTVRYQCRCGSKLPFVFGALFAGTWQVWKRTDTSSAIERARNSFSFLPKQITIHLASRHGNWIISYPQYLHQPFIDWFWFFLLWPETEECVNTAGENTLKTLLTPRDKYKLRFRGQFLWLLRWHFRFELEFL